jgi:nanoRNase/pAp phosphatase (c-di-AMP/oligoRNAs hydrolase)
MIANLDALRAIVANQPQLQIVPHNDPDPDAIAGALGMQYLLHEAWGIDAPIVYEGIIGRAENRALVRYLHSPLLSMPDAWLTRPSILVDTQPGAGNNPFPTAAYVSAVIDHHPFLEMSAEAPYVDVRPELGATASIIAEYLQQLAIPIPAQLATALFYGIKSDTLCLARGASDGDLAALLHLQPLVDEPALMTIERAQVSPEYFRAFHQALESTLIFGDVLVADIGAMTYPDWAAEMAEWFLRLESIQWVVCLGTYEGKIYLSIRTRHLRGGAGRVARDVIGRDGFAGGHGMAAGGQLPLYGREPADVIAKLRERVLRRLKIDENQPPRRLL